jgi:hypothetical protein
MPKRELKRQGGADNPAYVSFINPFCIIRPDQEEDFTVDLDQINKNTYNHGRLCRIVTALQSPQLTSASLLICADGAIAAPLVPELTSIEDVLDVFNDVMCCLLIGGHLCEAIDSRDIVIGGLHERRAIWPTNLGMSLNAHLHSTIRMRVASTIDTIRLNEPKNVSVSAFQLSYQCGRRVLDKIQHLSPTLLLRGFTELRYGNTVDALSNLWIVVEQLTEMLWAKRFIEIDEVHPSPEIPNRKRSLGKDTRTWSTSVRQEILFQMGVIPSYVYSKIYPARKARNDLVHQGYRPTEAIVSSLFIGVLDLLEIASGVDPSDLRHLDTRVPSEFHKRSEYDLTDWKQAERQLDAPSTSG